MRDFDNNWDIEDSKHLYQVGRWSDGYFSINSKGHLCVLPHKDESKPTIDIMSVINEAKKEGVQFPAVFRFHDVLREQVKILNESFNKTIKEAKFQGEYFGVYPIKVNQLREVVEEISDAGCDYNYGLEAGSKPELMTVLAYNKNPKAITVLNGYKDKDYIRLALLGTQIGKKIIIVVEKPSEIHHIIEVAQEVGIFPMIGVRAKLSSKAGGKWADSSGDFAKFGLTVPEIMDLINLLKEKNLLHILKFFHFHVGSQIPDIRTIKECITEGARIYGNLIQMGVEIEYFDVGGGVGINYDGTRSSCASSTNYNLQDYIGDVVYILRDICNDLNVKHPHIVSETGRAIAAHHSFVITDVFGNIKLNKHRNIDITIEEDDHLIIRNIKYLYRDLNHANYQDIYNDACIIKDEVINGFKLGIITLKQRALAESLYWNICYKIIEMTDGQKYVPLEIKKLKSVLADKYLCNFSLFQSAPDAWAIQQILPVLPVMRLKEKPIVECSLADITCDSDGKVSNFLGPDGQTNTLKIHPLNPGEEYYLGLFLTGAYQDIMGDMHNLFGRLNEVHVYYDSEDENNFYIEEIIKGNSSAEVLEIMQYNGPEMCKMIKNKIDQQVKAGVLKPRNGVRLVDLYENCLYGYTYLKNN